VEPDETLLTVTLPRRLYGLLSQFGPPRKVLSEIVSTVEPRLRQGIFNIDVSGPLVSCSFPVNEYVYAGLRSQGGDYCFRQVLEYLQTNQALPVDPFSYLGDGICNQCS
jgi:hypothetical protein